MRLREARPEDEADIVDVQRRSWAETYQGILPKGGADPFSLEARTELWRGLLDRAERYDRLSAQVVETGDAQIVGVVCMGPSRTPEVGYRGEIYAIYLLPDHQGKGWGRRLFHAAVEHLAEVGLPSLMLWVYAANGGARAFYERLGGRVVDRRDKAVGDETVEQVAYGWDPLPALEPTGQAGR